MVFYEQLSLFHTAYDFMKNNQYRLIHIKENEKEIWLEKTEHKRTNIIRLQQGGFDWKNHLKHDIAQVFQITKSMKKLLAGKEVMIHNIYISAYEPVDDWEQLKKPLQLEEKNSPIKMQVYYLTDTTKEKELHKLQETLSLTPFSDYDAATEHEANKALALYKQSFAKLIQSAKSKNKVFSYGKPFITYILIAVNLLMFLLLVFNGGSTNSPTLLKYGANYNLSIVIHNEWWRIISSMFLHIGWAHIAMNMIALYFLGSIVERIYGAKRFIIIYFLAGIGGGLASFLYPENISAG
ncbi:MAG TPA: rhomboid family intramembrane serine protease, partial [Bacillota bacterium]|nr:rhomboid family intramembrane serine protease [Bacillota bacterium]